MSSYFLEVGRYLLEYCGIKIQYTAYRVYRNIFYIFILSRKFGNWALQTLLSRRCTY